MVRFSHFTSLLRSVEILIRLIFLTPLMQTLMPSTSILSIWAIRVERGGKEVGTDTPENSLFWDGNSSTKVKDWRHKLQRAFLGKLPPAVRPFPPPP